MVCLDPLPKDKPILPLRGVKGHGSTADPRAVASRPWAVAPAAALGRRADAPLTPSLPCSRTDPFNGFWPSCLGGVPVVAFCCSLLFAFVRCRFSPACPVPVVAVRRPLSASAPVAVALLRARLLCLRLPRLVAVLPLVVPARCAPRVVRVGGSPCAGCSPFRRAALGLGLCVLAACARRGGGGRRRF